MTEKHDVRNLLVEIRDNQRELLERQNDHVEIARQQLERSNSQVEESIQLQREAVARARSIGRIAVPGIVLCLALILYLVTRYF